MCCSFLDAKRYGARWSNVVLKLLTNSSYVWLMSSLSEGSLVLFSSRSSRNYLGLKFFRHLILGLLFLHAVNVKEKFIKTGK